MTSSEYDPCFDGPDYWCKSQSRFDKCLSQSGNNYKTMKDKCPYDAYSGTSANQSGPKDIVAGNTVPISTGSCSTGGYSNASLGSAERAEYRVAPSDCCGKTVYKQGPHKHIDHAEWDRSAHASGSCAKSDVRFKAADLTGILIDEDNDFGNGNDLDRRAALAASSTEAAYQSTLSANEKYIGKMNSDNEWVGQKDADQEWVGAEIKDTAQEDHEQMQESKKYGWNQNNYKQYYDGAANPYDVSKTQDISKTEAAARAAQDEQNEQASMYNKKQLTRDAAERAKYRDAKYDDINAQRMYSDTNNAKHQERIFASMFGNADLWPN